MESAVHVLRVDPPSDEIGGDGVGPGRRVGEAERAGIGLDRRVQPLDHGLRPLLHAGQSEHVEHELTGRRG